MKTALIIMFIVTLLVAGVTLAYKSAQSLIFIKPGSEIPFPLGESAPSGKGVWRYSVPSDSWQQEKSQGGSLDTSRVFEFMPDAGNGQNIYAATSTGLYYYEQSQDAWMYLGTQMHSDAQVLSVSVNAHDNSFIFISTMQNSGASAIWRSQDAGKTFTQTYASLPQNEKIVNVVDDWYNPERVFALTSQGTFLRSDDEGVSWRVAYHFNRSDMTRLIMDSNDSRILYALQPDAGMLISMNSGDTWTSDEHAFAGLPSDAKIINDIRTVPGVLGHLYLATNYGILRSENKGKLFTIVHSLIAENSIPIQSVDVGEDSQTLFMAAGNSLYESRDGGKSWETHLIPVVQTIHTIISLSGGKVFAGT